MPLAIDLFCGLGGWAEGLLAEGYDVVGFDIERHEYGAHRYPAQLVMQDVLTVHGSQFRDAALIVASPPCQAYSWMAMPWTRAKAKAAEIRADATGQMLAELNRLFDACFRIQAQASLAAGRHIPLVVENVRGAQPWIGRARWNFGSFYLWGDVPALMPFVVAHNTTSGKGQNARDQAATAIKIGGGANVPGIGWTGFADTGASWRNREVAAEGIKQGGSGAEWWDKALDDRRREATAIKNGKDWFGSGDDCSEQRRHGSRSTSRKAASAMIAKIPLPLARWIAAVHRPDAT